LDTSLYELIYSQKSILPPPKIFTIPFETPCIITKLKKLRLAKHVARTDDRQSSYKIICRHVRKRSCPKTWAAIRQQSQVGSFDGHIITVWPSSAKRWLGFSYFQNED